MMNTHEPSQRNLAIDVIRSLACLLVMVIHSPMTTINTDGFVMASATLVGSPCIGLFFMVSGYLLLPTKETIYPFLRKRANRVIAPTLFWTAFYLMLIYCSGNTFQNQTWLRTILSIPFTRQGCGFLWFMYALMGLYVIAPIVSPWVKNASRKEMQFVIGLWLITTCYSFLRPFVSLTEDTYGMLYYFTGYAGYFLLGAYVKRFPSRLSIPQLLLLYLLPYAVALFARIKGIDVLAQSFGYLCLLTVMQVYAIFSLSVRLTPPAKPDWRQTLWGQIVVSFSNCSFGIYLMHKFVMMDVVWSLPFVSAHGGVFQILFTILLTVPLAWALTYGISLLPLSEYLVGYRNHCK